MVDSRGLDICRDTSLIPRLFSGGGKRAWYTLYAQFCGDRILSEYARIFMTSLTSATLVYSCNMERFLVCPPCYNEETEGLGLYRRFARVKSR